MEYVLCAVEKDVDVGRQETPHCLTPLVKFRPRGPGKHDAIEAKGHGTGSIFQDRMHWHTFVFVLPWTQTVVSSPSRVLYPEGVRRLEWLLVTSLILWPNYVPCSLASLEPNKHLQVHGHPSLLTSVPQQDPIALPNITSARLSLQFRASFQRRRPRVCAVRSKEGPIAVNYISANSAGGSLRHPSASTR